MTAGAIDSDAESYKSARGEHFHLPSAFFVALPADGDTLWCPCFVNGNPRSHHSYRLCHACSKRQRHQQLDNHSQSE